MAIVTDAQRRALLENGRVNAARVAADGDIVDFAPVVKLFCPWGAGAWLLSELDPEDPDVAHGLCDPGLGFPELGGVRLSELAALRGPGGLRIARHEFPGGQTVVGLRGRGAFARGDRVVTRAFPRLRRAGSPNRWRRRRSCRRG